MAARRPTPLQTIRDENINNPQPTQSRLTSRWQDIALTITLFALGLWAYWPCLEDITSAWTKNPDYTHGFFVVPISLWLLWARRGLLPRVGVSISWGGLLLLAVAAVIRAAAGRFYLPQLDAWTIPLWIAGLIWLFLGWNVLRWAILPIAFLWFATPLPGTIEIVASTPLQELATQLSAFTLRVVGQPALAEGTTILLDNHVLDVERACSGLRMFFGIFALAVACIAFARPARWKAILVLLAAAPIAIIANVVRIVATGLLMKFSSSEAAQKFSHDLAGLVMIPLAVALFAGFLVAINRIARKMREESAIPWLAQRLVIGVVILAALFFWGQYRERLAVTTLRDTAARYESTSNWREAVSFLTRYVQMAPNDSQAYVHLAELYRNNAVSHGDQIRAVEILRSAWHLQPERDDLALSAIQLALDRQAYGDAVKLCEEVLSKTQQQETRASTTKLRADALYAYLKSDNPPSDYTWENARNALEEATQLPAYQVRDAEVLADVYRYRLSAPAESEREKLADDLMDRIVKERANDPLAWLARYQYRLQNGDPKSLGGSEIEQDLDHALALSMQAPQNSTLAPVFLAAATRAQKQGNSGQAEDLLQKAIKVAPADTRAYFGLAELKRASGTKEGKDEAIRILREGKAQSGAMDLAIILPLASLLAENGQFDAAETEISPVEHEIPNIAGRQRGIAKLGVGLIRSQIANAHAGPPAAIKYLRDLLDDPDVRLTEQQVPQTLAQAYATLTALYSAIGAPDLALDAARHAIRIEPAKDEWRLRAAVLALQTGDLDEAESDYQSLAQSGAATSETLTAQSVIEVQRQLQREPKQRDWQQAKKLVRLAAQAGAPAVTVQLIAIEIREAEEEFDAAEKALLKLTEQFPNEPAFLRSLALLRQQRGNTQGALEAAARYADVRNQSVESVAIQAAILAKSQHPQEAVEALSKLVEKATPEQTPQAAIALSGLLIQLGQPAESQTVLEKAHAKVPDNLQLVDMLASAAWISQNWESLAKYESWLHDIEGDEGTVWKSYRAQRLLANARSVEDTSFKEVVALVDAVARERPRWPKAHFLQGEVALKMNQLDTAAAAYERAWHFGGRGVLLADRLIDVLSRQGRFADAHVYVVQARDYFSISPGLFDRAIPYLTQADEGAEMVQLAQQWVDRQPKDAEARLRLGRVLLVIAESSPAEVKDKYIQRAQQEFQRALELAPSDIHTWAANVILLTQNQATRGQATEVLQQFANRVKADDLPGNFMLAQLYDMAGLPAKAQQYFLRSSDLCNASAPPSAASEALGRAARFFSPSVPPLAEEYARRALAIDASNGEARTVLLLVLADRKDDDSLQEASRLLDESATKGSVDQEFERRIHATLLAKRGQPEDIDSAIDLLRQSLSRSREENLLLAQLYERSDRVAPAFELLEELARSATPQPNELAEFLRFWQLHFVTGAAAAESEPQFAQQASEVYQRLGELPNQLAEQLRWKLRELRVRQQKTSLAPDSALSAVSDLLSSSAAKSHDNAEERKRLLQRIMVVLIQEGCDEAAVQLATVPPKEITPVEAAVLLCHSYIAVPSTTSTESPRQRSLENLLATNPKDVDVTLAVADYWFMSGRYEAAAATYRRVLTLTPDHLMARNNLALALAELPGQLAEAKSALAIVMASHPDDDGLLDTQAILALQDNQAQQAIDVLKKLVDRNPSDPLPQLHLALAYDKTQDADAARRTLLAALVLGVPQQLLSPRDRETLADLQSRYVTPNVSGDGGRKRSSRLPDVLKFSK